MKSKTTYKGHEEFPDLIVQRSSDLAKLVSYFSKEDVYAEDVLDAMATLELDFIDRPLIAAKAYAKHFSKDEGLDPTSEPELVSA